MNLGRRLWTVAGWVRPEPLAAVVLWGGIYPGARLGLAEIPSLVFTYLRVVLAACVLALASTSGRSPSISRRLWAAILHAGLAQAAFQLLLIAGLARTTAGTSAILLAAAPLMAAGWLALTGRKRAPSRYWIGLAVGLAGVALVVRGAASGLGREQFLGNLIALAAAGAWAAFSLAIAPLAGALGAVRATKWSMVVAGIVLTPFALAGTVNMAWARISWPAWAGLVYGATAGMVVAMSLWGRSMHTLGPRETMVYVYLEPVSAVLIAAALLGERLAPGQIAGAALTFAGVWLASVIRPAAQRSRPAPIEVSAGSVTRPPRRVTRVANIEPGVYNIMATPFDDLGELDLPSLATLAKFQLARGVKGLTILGNLGEVRYLTDREREQVVDATISAVAGRVPVIVGMGFSGAHATIYHARLAEKAGAAGLMVAPPVGVRGQEAIVDHYARVGAATPLPIVIYDEPLSSGVVMPPATLARIVEAVPTATVIKLEDPPTPAKLTLIRRLTGTRAQIFGGLGGAFFLEELARGADGTMTGFAFTEILVAIYQQFAAGRHEKARAIFDRYLPLIRYEAQPGIGLALRKEILRRRGAMRTSVLRPPAQPLDKETLAELEATLAAVGLAGREAVAVTA